MFSQRPAMLHAELFFTFSHVLTGDCRAVYILLLHGGANCIASEAIILAPLRRGTPRDKVRAAWRITPPRRPIPRPFSRPAGIPGRAAPTAPIPAPPARRGPALRVRR